MQSVILITMNALVKKAMGVSECGPEKDVAFVMSTAETCAPSDRSVIIIFFSRS